MRFIVLLLPLLLLIAACGGDGVDTSTNPPEPPDLTVLENLVPALEDAYNNMNYIDYQRLIHEDYVFRVDPPEVDIIGAVEFSAAEDLEATESMFSGETGLEPVIDPATGLPTGEFTVVPPVQSIEFELTPDSASEWTEMETGEFEGALRRVFDLNLTVTFGGSTRVEAIRGKQVLYAVEGSVLGDTSGTLYWQIRGWEEQGIDAGTVLDQAGRANDATSLSAMKAQFLR